ncbi:hypothetical protein ABG768_028077 [Culter alburnus]|uniref:Uncharacterized protein n=1 Tax=Culter alburnus TaxID=194366 RepID=A0AAW2A8D2_CULAL
MAHFCLWKFGGVCLLRSLSLDRPKRNFNSWLLVVRMIGLLYWVTLYPPATDMAETNKVNSEPRLNPDFARTRFSSAKCEAPLHARNFGTDKNCDQPLAQLRNRPASSVGRA